MRRSRFSEEQVIGILKEQPGGPVTKGERPLEGFDDRILSLYARGMTVRRSGGTWRSIAVSSDLMSRVTDAVLGEVRE